MKENWGKYLSRCKRLMGREIWELENLGRRTARARMYQLLRVLTLAWEGLKRNNIPMQAAALTFYSMIGIGPLIAFGIMISGFLLEKDISDPNGGIQDSIVVEKLTQAITFAAPQVGVEIGEDGKPVSTNEISPEMLEMINNFSDAAKSGTVGVVGSLALLFIGIQVLTSIEKSFNIVWGVPVGRKLSERIVTYWTFISLGAVIGTACLTLISLNTFVSMAEELPFGASIASLIQFVSPVISFVMVTTLFAVFFRFIPNTQVNWKPAFTGAALAVFLLHLYNMLSFLYVQRVIDSNKLYGSVGIIIVLMLGLYVFWLLILVGGQVTYAVQNADFLTNENAWQKTSERSREVVALSVLLTIGRAFQQGKLPLRSSELNKKLRVPSHLLNTCLLRLCELGYLYPVEGRTAEEERDRAYQAGKPLESITLGSFKQAFDTHGNNDGVELLSESDPVIRQYLEEVVSLKDLRSAEQKISELV